MPGSHRTPLHRDRGLSWEERQALEGWNDDFYATEDDRREGWERHRERLLDECHDGWRPLCWWLYDAPIERPDDPNYAAATLWEHKLLYPDEVVMLERRWREHFNHCNSPDWTGICVGNDPQRHCAIWVKDEEGRQASYHHHGIPPALVKRWTNQRNRTIRKLAKSAA